MKRTLLLLLILATSIGLAAQTADEIISKAIAARGGLDKLKAIQTQRLTGTITIGNRAPGPFMVEMKRGGKMRQEMTVGGQNAVRITNGTAGWKIENDGEAVPLTDAELRNMAGGADIDGPLVDYKAKGNQVELEGKEKVNGNDAYKLKITQKDGQVRYDYLDVNSFLEVKWQGEIEAGDRKFTAESFFSDYRPVNGVMYHHQIDSDTLGTPYKQKLVFDKIEVNLPLDDSIFQKPPPSAPTPQK